MSVQTEEKKRPEISVIVPVYNVAPYLSACLDSVLAQTFRDFELILVEDGSTDGSREIAEAYAAKDVRVRIIEHRWNRGAATSYAHGLELSRGEYIAFVDCDDMIVPTNLEVLQRAAEASNADVVQAGFRTFSEKNGGRQSFCMDAAAGLSSRHADGAHAAFFACTHSYCAVEQAFSSRFS